MAFPKNFRIEQISIIIKTVEGFSELKILYFGMSTGKKRSSVRLVLPKIYGRNRYKYVSV